MIRIFTYHKVGPLSPRRDGDFYTVSPEELEHHLETFAARGWQPRRLQDLDGSSLENKYVMTFDDGTIDHYEVVFPLLEKHRCHGSFYVPRAKLNLPGYMTEAQAREMAAAGHEIGSHSHEHRRMDVMTEEEVREQISRSQEMLANITGKKPVTLVPPGGFSNECVERVARELGMRALRTMRWGYNQKWNPMALETIPLNRHTDARKFEKLMEPHRAPVLYAGKEMLKRLMPLRSYSRLRGLAFRIWNFN